MPHLHEPGWRRTVWDITRFFLLNLAVCLAMFWPAATGEKLFAPLDIPASLFSKFKYVDPNAGKVPGNHYVIDMMLGDVSRNLLVYDAWKRGEAPWWDPYTDGGKPLAAEANAVNISDPFKVALFHLLPFELAYNWIRITTFLVCGLGAFCLLRHFRLSFLAALWGGLLYEFAGCNAMIFSGPTVQACFSYFPFLWLLWDKAAGTNRFIWFAASAPVAALMFLSGNLQSHSYIFLFAPAFWFGYGWGRPRRLWFLTAGTGVALTLGLCLAAPFLISQIELFFLATPKVKPFGSPLGLFTGLFSAVTIFPWLAGTFRTLDVCKAVDQYGLGFWPYIGSAALVMAMLGAFLCRAREEREQDLRRTALGLVGVYLIVCSTPLLRVLYTRTAWLAVLGLVVLWSMSWDRLTAITAPLKRWGWGVVALAVALAAAVNLGGGLLYPRMQAQIESRVMALQSRNQTLDEATPLRQFQLANFQNEVTFRNREPLVAFLGLLALGLYLLRPPATRRALGLCGVMLLSTLPVLWFLHRYVPQHPVVLLQKIREGGPEQQRVAAMLKTKGLRLRELAPGTHDYLFPGAMAQFLGVHVLHGHSSLVLLNASTITNSAGAFDPAFHDVAYHSEARGMERGEVLVRANGPPARFRWAAPSSRSVEIAEETLTTITLAIGSGPAGELIRTDTYYPGWRVAAGSPGAILQYEPPCFARITVPASVQRLKLVYEPRGWHAGIGMASLAAALWATIIIRLVRRQRSHDADRGFTTP